MNRYHRTVFITAVTWLGCAGTTTPPSAAEVSPPPGRTGAVAGVSAEGAERCRALHKAPHDIGKRLRDAGILNYAVYQKEIDVF